jgi:hypothetical protein
MTFRTGNPTLRGVVDQIERRDIVGQQPAIEDNGRAVRLSKGKDTDGQTIYEIRTRPTGKGREWNFARRIAQERALVEKFEKEIDRCCGEGMGKKLTKGVGAYDKLLNPKLDAEQLRRLKKRADQIEKVGQPPPGLKVQFDDDDNLMWVGRVTLNETAIELMKESLKSEFKSHFIKPGSENISKDTVVLVSQFEKDKDRSNMILDQKTNLRGRTSREVCQILASYLGDDAVAASNITAVMTQASIGCFDVPCAMQTKFVTGDQSDLRKEHPNANKLSFKTERQDRDYLISFESHRALNAISYGDGSQSDLDSEKSWSKVAFGLRISQSDLSKGVADNIKLVGKPYVEYSVYPKPAPAS